MNPTDYTNLAMRTASPSAGDHGVSTDLVHAVMGIADEAWELLDAKSPEHVIEELGDLLWFCALADSATDGGLFGIYAGRADRIDGSTPYDIATSALRLAGLIKKPYAYGKALPVAAIQAEVLTVIAAVDAIANRLNVTLEEVMELNLLKLKMRFPERFDCADAIKRNVAHERALFVYWQTVLPIVREAGAWLLCRNSELEHARDWMAAHCDNWQLRQLSRSDNGYWIVYTLPSPTATRQEA